MVRRERFTDGDGDLWDMAVWEVPAGRTSPQGVRYRLAFVPGGSGAPAVLYDNHHPKGHHKHVQGREMPYEFGGVRRLVADFRVDVQRWKESRGS